MDLINSVIAMNKHVNEVLNDYSKCMYCGAKTGYFYVCDECQAKADSQEGMQFNGGDESEEY